MYSETMINMLQKVRVELPKQLIHKEKHQSILHAIRGYWCMKTIGWEASSPKETETKQNIARKLGWNKKKSANGKSKLEWLNIWDTLEKNVWVNPRSRNE